jgi:predicted TIM-barrel fold metal-dependent hydrolase
MCASPWLGIFVPDDAGGNDITAAAVREFREEIIGYATLDPTHRKDIVPEMHRCYFELGLKGVKPYVQNGLPFDHDLYTPWWEFANEHRLFALIHGNEGPVVKLSDQYPEVTFLLAHRAGSYGMAREAIALIKDRNNVLIEITYTPVPQDIIEFIVSEVGAGKIVFGTDAPMRDPRPQFGWTIYSKLSTEEKRKILGENMLKVLGRVRLGV